MLPVYDPKAFDGIDLRKYHIRDIKDVIKFNEFVASRMEEAQFVLKKFNNQYATYTTVAAQLQKRVQQQQATYGTPTNLAPKADAPAEIQKVDDSVEKEHEDLLAEVKKAVAEDTLIPDEGEDPNARAVVELGKYKVVKGKKGYMFYRNGDSGYKLVGKNDVPEDIKQQLIDVVENK